MKKSNKQYSKVKNLSKIAHQKRILETKLKIRKHLMNKHIRDLGDDFSGDYVFRQSMKTMKINNPIFSFIPGFVKGVKPGKKILVPLFSGFGAAIGVLFLMRDKKNQEPEKE